MAACPICGAQLAGAPKQCPACNTDLAHASSLMNDIIGAPPPPRVATPPKPTEKTPFPYVRLVVTALLWGWGLAAVLALIVGTLLHLIIGEEGGSAAFKSGLNFGGMLGFLLGSIWGTVSVLELELGMAALAGAIVGAADTTIHYFAESTLIAPPDLAAYLYTIIGCGAGAAAGAFSIVLRNFRENA